MSTKLRVFGFITYYAITLTVTSASTSGEAIVTGTDDDGKLTLVITRSWQCIINTFNYSVSTYVIGFGKRDHPAYNDIVKVVMCF